MIIGIDGNEANSKNRVGIGQFAFGVISSLEKIDNQNSYLIYLKNSPVEDLPKPRENWQYLVFGPKKYWTQLALPLKLLTQKNKPDIFYSPSHYGPRFSPVPTIISLMDLWHHRHPEQFAKKDLYQLIVWENFSVKKAKHIITISEFSKKEILDIYKLPEDKVTVTYPGYTKFEIRNTKFETNSKILNIKNKFKIKGEYFLYLGTLQPKKNLEGLIKAFDQVDRYLRSGDSSSNTKHLSPITLVIAGKKGWLYDQIFKLVKDLKLSDKVIFTDFIDEQDKPFLMMGAKAFVLPSFYEGFGIPVLEAMNLGVPVIAAKAGSLPEVGGEAAVYCDPLEVESITKAMEAVLNLKEERRNEIITQGYKQVLKFSWDKCASQILTVLEKNAKKSS